MKPIHIMKFDVGRDCDYYNDDVDLDKINHENDEYYD